MLASAVSLSKRLEAQHQGNTETGGRIDALVAIEKGLEYLLGVRV